MTYYRALLLMFGFITGCASVGVSVNSIRNAPTLTRSTPVVFPKKSEAIENEKMRRECIKGAKAANINVVDNCEKNCLWASVEGTTGNSKERTASFSNVPYYSMRQSQVYSYNVTQKQVKIALYSDPEMKNLAYQAVLDSIGIKNNVLADAEEMCEAGFKTFPEESSGDEYNIRSR